MRGPIDYIIVGFEGNKFDGSILQALADAIDKGTIALVALCVIAKDDAGDVALVDISQVETDIIDTSTAQNDLITQDDVDEVADLLENNTSAGLLIIEQLWAKPLKQALIDAKGVLVAEGRIHPEALAELTTKEA